MNKTPTRPGTPPAPVNAVPGRGLHGHQLAGSRAAGR